ncbi:hypothetical protein CS542_07260 [Pedobacter sp. IW39]|nr:hypothetical protein CS542_07260 [Pedobacter sp. IW39]
MRIIISANAAYKRLNFAIIGLILAGIEAGSLKFISEINVNLPLRLFMKTRTTTFHLPCQHIKFLVHGLLTRRVNHLIR